MTNKTSYVSETDLNLPYIFPFSGVIEKQNYQKICSILCTCFDDYKSTGNIINDINFIKANMSIEKLALVANGVNEATGLWRVTGGSQLDKSSRICHKKTFGNVIATQIGNLILNNIEAQSNSLRIPPEEIILDTSNGSILYYEQGGFFNYHRDTVYKFPNKDIQDSIEDMKLWRMYNLLISIDFESSSVSEIAVKKNEQNDDDFQDLYSDNLIYEGDEHEDDECLDINNDGSTEVFLPSFKLLQNPISHEKKNLNHIYLDSCTPSRFLILPAEALHRSIPMHQKGHKLILKFNIWLKQPTLTENLHNYSFFNYCKCVLCDLREPLIKEQIALLSISPINKNLLRNIAEYIVPNIKRKECICDRKRICECACIECLESLACCSNNSTDRAYHENYDNAPDGGPDEDEDEGFSLFD
jgi:hypothetical protein